MLELAALLVWLAAPAYTAPSIGTPAPRNADPRPFDGPWNSTFGRLDLYQVDDNVIGRYGLTGSLLGTIEGGRLVFRFSEPQASGEGWFEIEPDGATLTGQWRLDNAQQWHDWTATSTAPADPGFFGLWDTTFGKLRLVPDGDRVTGCYDYGNGAIIEGAIDDDQRLNVTFTEPDGSTGDARFELSPDGSSLVGQWRPTGAGDDDWEDWTGTRILPHPDRTYLVVLEADWEADIQDREFAFGEMLRAYFTMSMTAHVEVRVRQFMDQPDLERWCRDVAFIPEPVIVLISSHGSNDGITVRGQTIGPSSLAGMLAHAPNVGLLHLSGCDMASGSMPRRLLREMPASTRCPISGYATTVAWDASALADFTYLTMILAHGLDPAAAARQAIIASPYIGSDPTEGLVFVPLGLRVFTPE